MIELIVEYWKFLKSHRKLWMLPLLIILVLFGSLLIFAQTSALAPFIYTIF